MENKQYVILDGEESMLLGIVPQFSVEVGDLAMVAGDVFSVFRVLPAFVSADPEAAEFILQLYDGATGREPVEVTEIYRKQVLSHD